jgi:hypothetical protein
VIVSWATYKDVTGDTATTEAIAVARLARAQKRAEDVTGRQFDLVERTESVPIIDGKVWPSAYPIASVSVPDTATVDDDKLSITTGVTTPVDSDLLWTCTTDDRPHLLVTYIGGYTADTAPVTLAEIICEIAHRYSIPANTVGVPGGTTSVRVGNQGYSGGPIGGSSALPQAIRNQLIKYLHIRARMAD